MNTSPPRHHTSCPESFRTCSAERSLQRALDRQGRTTSVTPLPGYRVAVTFDDGTSGVVDLTDRVHRLPTGVFAELQDPARFAQVFIDREGGHLAWPNGADVDPYLLYDESHASLSR